eukprot:9479484-Pyramimonas_sp.AAC.1
MESIRKPAKQLAHFLACCNMPPAKSRIWLNIQVRPTAIAYVYSGKHQASARLAVTSLGQRWWTSRCRHKCYHSK